MKTPSLTIGIEEEYQIIDPETRELRSYITEILQEDDYILRVESEFLVSGSSDRLRGFFLLLPDPASLAAMLRAVRVS